jgi:Undecaprenyl pyrophosphate synthase
MHVGIIPDGNRRYAETNSIDERQAYRESKETVKRVSRALRDKEQELSEITIYILSEDNLKRSDEELDTLFSLLRDEVSELREFFNEHGFSANWASTRPEALPEDVRKQLQEIDQEFNEGGVTVNMLVSYSGKSDIISASQQLCQDGNLSEEDLSEELEVRSEIDFVIRTGKGPRRECLSGFPIWNSSYAEYYHIDKNFPEIESRDIEEALEHFRSLRRRRGE